MKGTITWFEVAKELPAITYRGQMASYSDKVLLTNERSIHVAAACYSITNNFLNWEGSNLIPFEPTHWGYINFP